MKNALAELARLLGAGQRAGVGRVLSYDTGRRVARVSVAGRVFDVPCATQVVVGQDVVVGPGGVTGLAPQSRRTVDV